MSVKETDTKPKRVWKRKQKKHLTSKTKYGIMIIPKEKRGKNLK